MIVCQVCGTSNAAGERFCAQCGAFLEWDGARVDEPGAAAAPGPSSGAAAPSVTEAPAATGAFAGSAAPAPAAAPVRAGPRPEGGDPAAGASADTGPAGAAAPTAAQPAEARPTEVRPGAPRRQRAATPPPPPVRAPREGDLTCGGCGAGNEPARRFCRSCGASLATAATVRPPWWRRLLRRLTGGSSYQAGQRRQRRARPVLARTVRLLTLVAVLATAVAFGPGAVRWVVNEVRDRTQDHVPLSPAGFRASSARSGAPAERIADGASNRYWAPTGSGENAWVEASFAQPVRLLDVVVTPGISPQQDQFLAAGRPRTLEVSAERASGTGATFVLELRDAPGPQAFAVEAEGVVRVRITVRSSYGPAAARGVAVAEVEFFGRS